MDKTKTKEDLRLEAKKNIAALTVKLHQMVSIIEEYKEKEMSDLGSTNADNNDSLKAENLKIIKLGVKEVSVPLYELANMMMPQMLENLLVLVRLDGTLTLSAVEELIDASTDELKEVAKMFFDKQKEVTNLNDVTHQAASGVPPMPSTDATLPESITIDSNGEIIRDQISR